MSEITAPCGALNRKQVIIGFMLILALAFIVRLNLATYVRTCFYGDEAVVGVMAYNIEDRGERFLYPYGETHNGGGVIEAHAAAALNAAFGRSELNLRLPVIFSFVFFVAVSMLLAMRAIGPLPGIFFGLQLIFCPHLYRPSLYAIGYMEILAIMALCCYIVYSRMMGVPAAAKEQNPPPVTWGALLGLLTGVAFWGGEYSAMMAAALFAAYGLRWRKKAFPVLSVWAISFLLGAAPLILYNLNTDFLNFRHLMGSLAPKTPTMPILEFFTKDLPSIFQNDYDRHHNIPWIAWTLFIATTAGSLLAIIISVKTKRKTFSGSGILMFGFAYCIFYSVMYLASPFRGDSTRYLLPLEPFLSLGLVAGITALIRTRRAAALCLAAALIVLVITADTGGTIFAFKDDTIDVVYDYEMDVKCDVIYGQIDRLAMILEKRGIPNVYTNMYLKWIILFHTEEKIKVADVNLRPGAVPWTEYEDMALDWDRQAFYFNNKDPRVPWLKAYLKAHGIPYYSTNIDYNSLIMPVSHVSSLEFTDWCRKIHMARTQIARPAGHK